jgi:hypothetical protein
VLKELHANKIKEICVAPFKCLCPYLPWNHIAIVELLPLLACPPTIYNKYRPVYDGTSGFGLLICLNQSAIKSVKLTGSNSGSPVFKTLIQASLWIWKASCLIQQKFKRWHNGQRPPQHYN